MKVGSVLGADSGSKLSLTVSIMKTLREERDSTSCVVIQLLLFKMPLNVTHSTDRHELTTGREFKSQFIQI